ncbi:MAG: acyltransferase [Rhodopila sp.]|nr:acyltransferase [Rhodopila sp.]
MKRLECLDGLRGLLAVYVLLGHMAPFAVLPGWLQRAVSHGGAAVDLFFVLSGLVITQSLQRADGRMKPFLVARVTRIFPVFLLVFALAVAVQPWSCGFERMPWVGPDDAARTICVMAWPHAWMTEILAHLTMTHGLFPNCVLPDVWVSFLGAAWSLSTEWQFYVLALFVAGMSGAGHSAPLSRPAVPKRARIRACWEQGLLPHRPGPAPAMTESDAAACAPVIHHQTLCWILLGLAAAGFAWRMAAPDAWQFSRAFLPNKGHFFALGVASVPIARRETRALTRYLVVLLLTLAVCATQESAGKMLPPLAWTFCLAVQMRPDMVGLAMAGRLLRSRPAQYLGAISYCLYLVNEPIHKLAGTVLSRIADGDATLFTLFWLPVSIGLPIVASGWLHAYLEVPMLRRGRLAARRHRLCRHAPGGYRSQ